MDPVLSLAHLKGIFTDHHVIAVVGLSAKPERPSHRVARYLQQVGYRIIPVNPGQDEILGQTFYPNLRAIPGVSEGATGSVGAVDVVNIFRRAEQVGPIVEDAVAIGAKVVWMQQGIINEEAAQMAEQAGLTVIMDRCMLVDHRLIHGCREDLPPDLPLG